MSISDPELLAQLKSRCPHCWAIEVDTRINLEMEAGVPTTEHLIAGEWIECPLTKSWAGARLGSTSICPDTMVWFEHQHQGSTIFFTGRVLHIDHGLASIQLYGAGPKGLEPLPKIVTRPLSMLTPATVAYVDKDVLEPLEPSPRTTWW